MNIHHDRKTRNITAHCIVTLVSSFPFMYKYIIVCSQWVTSYDQMVRAQVTGVLLDFLNLSPRQSRKRSNSHDCRPSRSREMQSSFFSSPSIPSPAVLRFLKIQAESLRFFSTTSTAPTTLRPTAGLQASCRSSSWSVRTFGHVRCRNVIPQRRVFTAAELSLTGDQRPRVDVTTSTTTLAIASSGKARLHDGSRLLSSSSQPQERWKAWNMMRRQKPTKALRTDDLPSPLLGLSDDSASLGRVARPSNELKLRCTEFDENGNVTLVNGEFKKSELIAKVRITYTTIVQ